MAIIKVASLLPFFLALLNIISFVLLVHGHKQKPYEIPTPEVNVFTPKGFRLCISDSPNIVAVTLNANINKPINKGDTNGQISMVLNEPVKGRWLFIDENVKLNVSDKVYYTMTLFRNSTLYGLDGHYVVKHLIKDPIATYHYHTCGPDTQRRGILSVFKSAPKHEITRSGPINQEIDVRIGAK